MACVQDHWIKLFLENIEPPVKVNFQGMWSDHAKFGKSVVEDSNARQTHIS